MLLLCFNTNHDRFCLELVLSSPSVCVMSKGSVLSFQLLFSTHVTSDKKQTNQYAPLCSHYANENFSDAGSQVAVEAVNHSEVCFVCFSEEAYKLLTQPPS